MTTLICQQTPRRYTQRDYEMAKQYKVTGFKELYRDLDKIVSTTLFAKYMADVENRKHLLAMAIIFQGTSGIGPEGKPYQAYSPAYKTKKDKAGHRGKWLRGIGRGKDEGMLSIPNFKASSTGTGVKSTNGKMLLKWKNSSREMTNYAHFHNWGDGKIPQREWMHLYTKIGEKAVNSLLQEAGDMMAADFQAGTL